MEILQQQQQKLSPHSEVWKRVNGLINKVVDLKSIHWSNNA